jgi:hypothetical protein
MLSRNTLRNIHKKDFKLFFGYHKVKLRSKRIEPIGIEDRYLPISRMLHEEISTASSFREEELDSFLFNQLFYGINNWQYVYQNADKNKLLLNENPKEIIRFFENYDEFRYNSLLVDKLGNEKFELCTTRLEFSDNTLKNIHFLFKIGVVVSNGDYYNFFSAISIDIETNLVIFRFDQHLLDGYEIDPLDLISSLKDILNGVSSKHEVFDILELNVTGLHIEAPKRIISALFKELSAEAEEILDREVPPNTENDIREFLEGKGLPFEEDYIQQIKSVLFQDIAQKCADTLFVNGWVFRFVFREGQLTRASSRTDDKSPIYGSKVYWHLKELIFKSDEMKESGFHWYLTDPTETESPEFVQVRLEARNDSLIVHYYYKMRSPDRKEKEDYVLRKIKEYL